MRFTSLLTVVWFVTGCGAEHAADDDVTPDAPPDAAAPRSCKQLGALVRDPQPFRTTSGAAFHPAGIVADPHVLHEDGRYRMWFTSVDWTAGSVFSATDRRMGTAYVESADGALWDDQHLVAGQAGHKVDLVLPPGDWDSEGVETISVARASDDELVAFYTGDRPDGTYAIGRARSADGLSWRREPGPVLTPEQPWEQPVCLDPPGCTQLLGGVLEPSYLYDPVTGTHRVWYAALGLGATDLTMQIGHAWSNDGITWQRSPTPVFSPGEPGAWDEILVSHTNVVPDPVGGFHLFYQGISRAQQAECDVEGSCTFYTPGSIGHAYSPDGSSWARDPGPILTPSGEDGFFVGGPSAVFRDGRLELFYFGIASRADASMLSAHLARATADCR